MEFRVEVIPFFWGGGVFELFLTPGNVLHKSLQFFWQHFEKWFAMAFFQLGEGEGLLTEKCALYF